MKYWRHTGIALIVAAALVTASISLCKKIQAARQEIAKAFRSPAN
jgi:hypothetical protein